MAEPFLSISNLRLTAQTDRGTATILRGVDLNVERGHILGIVGESGSGKSSLVSTIMGLLAPGLRTEGSITLDGVDLLRLDSAGMAALRGNKLAMIFQDPMTALNPVFRVGTQLVDVVLNRYPGTSHEEAVRRASDALVKVGLSDAARRMKDYPGQLSGGMRQRVMIAMALLCQPDILIADEPTTALDATIEAQIIDLLRRLRNEFSGSIIFISHNLGTVMQLCDEVAVMYGGHLVEVGAVRDVLAKPLHPYSRALIGCEIDDQPLDVPLAFIPGKVPETLDNPTGCIFAPRCNYATTACERSMPALRPFNGQMAACVRLEEIA
ncbi:ABC transporter ATP-binding protein [Devosia faecipullorum]|uniref:ABC transporter ATP-binding protein n=1 Tax=Devosia faecipullorum TaxID=2755039 RepID=UPI00187B8A92|nr:ABC transporter ATP-binding protein [Devosia faecipullorum]MBE7732842.1 ABC transporter ATP-binding protein [Devosia faecipullorum]